MGRKTQHDNTHLTLEERRIIQAGIENGATKASIGRTIGKDETTVGKEIRKHRQFRPRNTYGRPVLCGKERECRNKPCREPCELYEEPKCTRRDRSPGACNKCSKNTCRMDKYYYDAVAADRAYRSQLAACREGINLEPQERKQIGEIIAPLLAQGQSVHQILCSHSEISVSERTLYSYIESGVFKEYGVTNFSLKEQVNRKQFRKCKKRKEPAVYQDRRYADFLSFCQEHPDTPITEMDTVYNHPSGPYLQTFLFRGSNFMIGFLHRDKTSESMANTINLLQQRLDPLAFSRLFPLLLTDRGSEFERFTLFEQDANGQSRLRIFYCDPMQSSQKPHVENNHNYVRDILPNGYPMDGLSQDNIDLMFSHINSTPRRSLMDKTPYEMFVFLHGTSAAHALNIHEIPRDSVILKPALIFRKNA